MSANGPSWGRRWVVQQLAIEHERRLWEADAAACRNWNLRMAHGGPSQPSPTIGSALNGWYLYLRVRCTACRRPAFVALAEIHRPPDTPIWQLEDALACLRCRERDTFAPRTRLELLTVDAGDVGWNP